MGYGQIVSGGEDGRYVVYLDFGHADKLAIINGITERLAVINLQIIDQQTLVDQAADVEDGYRLALAELTNATTAAMTAVAEAGGDDAAMKAALAAYQSLYTHTLTQYRQVQGRNEPARINLRKLKVTYAQGLRDLAKFQSAVSESTREAWCADLTTDLEPDDYVGTAEVNGESELVLIVPGGAEPINGDGTILLSTRTAILEDLGTKLVPLAANLATVEANIVTAEAELVTLKATRTTAQATYNANKTPENLAALNVAIKAVLAKETQLTSLRKSRGTINAQIGVINAKISYWGGRAASAEPVYGSGRLYARELMSPEQVFYNAALLPGWQKYKPTFRQGTVSSINYEAHTATVTLADATSSVPQLGLDINQATTLTEVDIEYMACDSAPFAEGDDVLVKFEGLDWTRPKIVGFITDPKACDFTCIGSGPVYNLSYPVFFQCISDDAVAIEHAMDAGSAVMQVRRDRGAWETMTLDTTFPEFKRWTFEFPTSNPTDYPGEVEEANLYTHPGPAPLDSGFGPYTWPPNTNAVIAVQAAPPYSNLDFPNVIDPGDPYVIYEYRVTISGDVVFNVAIEDSGWDADGDRNIDSYGVRTRYGIANSWSGDGYAVHALPVETYQLFIETGD